MASASTVLRRQAAFFRKGLLLDASYRAAFVARLLGGLVPLTFFFFLKELVDARDPRLAAYGGDYFAFVAIGVALSQYFAIALGACVKDVRNAQMAGVLETTLSARTTPLAVIVHGAVYHFTFALLHFTVVLLAATALFGLDLSRSNWVVFGIGFAAAAAAFLGLAVLSAGVIVHTKSPEPLQLVLGGLGSFVAGAYFPVAVLPEPLRAVAAVVPMTHALDVLRAALLTGARLDDVARPLGALALLAAVSLGGGAAVLGWAVARARADGSLGQY